VVRREVVRLVAAVAARVDVYVDHGKLRLGVKQRVAHFLGEAVALARGQVLVDGNTQLSLKTVSKPSNTHFAGINDAVDSRRSLDALGDLWVDRIH